MFKAAMFVIIVIGLFAAFLEWMFGIGNDDCR
jgi:hypothetical protein